MTREEAVQEAIKLLSRWLPASDKHSGGETFVWFGAMEAIGDSECQARILEEAECGDRDADGVIRELGSRFIAAGVLVPDLLKDYLARAIKHAPIDWDKKHHSLLPRNFIIAYLVARFIEHGFPLSRRTNSEKKGSAWISSVTNRQIISMIGPGGFPANNFSEQDRKFIQSTFPQLGDTPDAIRVKTEVMKRVSELQMDRADALSEALDQGKSYQQFDRDYRKKIQGMKIFDDLKVTGGSANKTSSGIEWSIEP